VGGPVIFKEGGIMNSEEMRLPHLEKSAFVTGPVAELRFHPEWYIDPAFWKRLPDDRLVNIYRIKMKYLAQLTKIEMQIKDLEGDMFNEMAEALAMK
jgi:hypothetical protein